MIYDDHFLLSCFYNKAQELGRPPTSRELSADKKLPHYITFRRRLGKKAEICRALDLENTSRYTHDVFCRDCREEPESCNRKVKDCLADADDYLRMAG